jgi:nitrous oxidase accessory protein NosD
MMNNISIKTVYLLLLLITLPLHSEIRYVSKTGAAQPPYTSWATASDSIQKCINISSFGDTIYVGNGVYKEQIIMISGLSLIGGGMDSCVIDTRELVLPTDFYAVTISDTTLLRGFKIIVSDMYPVNNYYGTGIKNLRKIKNAIIEFNLIYQMDTGIFMNRDSDSIIIRKNIVKNSIRGIELRGVFGPSRYFVEDNYIDGLAGFFVDYPAKTKIKGNLIITHKQRAITSWSSKPQEIYNNIIIQSDTLLHNYPQTSAINLALVENKFWNNIVMGAYSYCFTVVNNNSARNNVFINVKSGFNKPPEDSIYDIKYNNVWNVSEYSYLGFTPDSTNMSVDPMFVDTSGWDFRLQKHSPLIDAGDPDILDVDGTRSDIGVYGGPYGMSYPYEDLAPGKPRGTELLQIKNKTFLRWRKNTESDVTDYKIYYDTIPDFPVSQQTYIASEGDTLIEITDLINSGIPRAYLKVTAVDSLGNESAAGEEVLWGDPLTVQIEGVIPQVYKLYQNYPNPFNPSTTIGYMLKNRGYVKLIVYDIKGEMVEVITNEWKERGYHESEFRYSGQKITSLASGIYLYKLEVIDENMIPVFTDIRKMILIK